MPKSDAGSVLPERSSVYDFLYHDARRIASFLAQFSQYGHLESLTRSRSTTEAASDKGAVSGRAGLPLLGSVGGAGEMTASESVNDALTRTYDPLWANALDFLDHLTQRDLIHRDVTQARIGQFVLARGNLEIVNLGTLRAAWREERIRKLFDVGTGGSKDRRARREEMQAGLAFVGLLPHSIQATLRGTSRIWCSLQESGMATPADDLLLKHGVVVSGTWSVLGILDALPDGARGETLPADTTENMATLMRGLAPAAREFLGRPRDHYGVTPLLILREIGRPVRE